MATRIILAGITGWVGQALVEAIGKAGDLSLAAGVARKAAGQTLGGAPVFASVGEAIGTGADVLIDYTKPDAVKANTLAALEAGLHVVIGTSGLSAEDYAGIDTLARSKGKGVVAAGNFSVTATLLKRFALEAARHVADVEVIDYAYQGKPDTPSGTGRELGEMLSAMRQPSTALPVERLSGIRETRGGAVGGPNPVQVHSVRMPGYVLSCEALFGLPDERLVIRHDAGASAAPYVGGTLLAARKVGGMTGLTRGLDALMFS